MQTKKKNRSVVRRGIIGTIDPNMKDYGNDAFFVKKAQEAKALLKSVGLPKSNKKK